MDSPERVAKASSIGVPWAVFRTRDLNFFLDNPDKALASMELLANKLTRRISAPAHRVGLESFATLRWSLAKMPLFVRDLLFLNSVAMAANAKTSATVTDASVLKVTSFYYFTAFEN